MKFRIFADSWAWLWREQIVKSKSMIAHSGSPYRFSLVKTILEGMGHEVDITSSLPGASLNHTTEEILEALDNLPEDFQGDEIWLHMISSPIREVNKDNISPRCEGTGYVFVDHIPDFKLDLSSIDNFFESHDKEITRQLQRISDKLQDIRNNINIISLGGHIVLPKHSFDAIKNCNPKLKFGSEWILNDVEEDLCQHVFSSLVRLWGTKWNGPHDPGIGPFTVHRWNQAYRVFFNPSETLGDIFASGNLKYEPDLEFLDFLNDI